MIPFARVLNYGNTVLKTSIKKIAGWQTSLYVLSSDNKLYVRGKSTSGEYGTGSNVTDYSLDWHMLRDDVDEFWVEDLIPGLIFKTTDNKWYCSGNVAGVIPGISNTNVFTDITAIIYSDGTDIAKFYTTRHGLYKISTSGVVKVISPTSFVQFGMGSTVPSTWTALSHGAGPIDRVLDTNGNWATWLLSTSGYLYRCGNDSASALANNGTTLSVFTKLVLPGDAKCIDMSCDALAYKCLTQDGVLYSWGTNYYSTATPGSTESPGAVRTPTMVTNTLSYPVKKLYTSWNVVSYIGDNSNRLLCNGYNSPNMSAGAGSSLGTLVNYVPNIQSPGDSVIDYRVIDTITACGNYASFIRIGQNVYGSGIGSYLHGGTSTTIYSKMTKIKMPWEE